MPSTTSTSASAAQQRIRHAILPAVAASRVAGLLAGACAAWPPWFLKYWKNSELGSSTITSLLFAERRPVGLEAAVERVELGVAAVGLRVDRRRLGVAVALDLLRLPVGVGEDHLALAVGVGADLLATRPAPSERSSLATRRRSDSIRA